MCDLAQVTDLISDIYDAALDARLWPQALRRALRLLDTHGPDLRTDELRNLLTPHFRRAAAISRMLERSESRASALTMVLDRLSAAVVFVDRTGRLVHANAPAAQRLSEGDVLAWVNGNPVPCSEPAAAHLRAILAGATQEPLARGGFAFSAAHTARSGERVTLHILPLSAGPRRHALAPCAAAAAILVSRCGSDLTQRIESAARLYDFTPAESRVVQVLLGGCTIGRVAVLLGVAEATVKTHLQHVFDKTGTRRQVDLARLIVDRAEPARLSG